jgi:RHS repeat-associated protein
MYDDEHTTMTQSAICASDVCFAPTRFTGKERDTESGNDYFDARYYSSAVGRFMSPDWSAKTEPVPYSRLGNPQTLNLFAYVQNNPLTQFDPDGHCLPTLTSALSDLKNYAKSAVNRGIAWVSQHTSSGQKEGSQILVGGSTKIGPANVNGGVGYGSGSHSYALSPVGAAGQAGGQLSAFHGEVKTSSSKTTFDAATASGEINGEAGLTGKGGGIAAGVEGHLDVISASDQAQWGPFTLTVTGEVGLGAELGGSLTNSGASFKAGLTDGIGGDFALSVNWGGSGVTSSVKGTSEGEFTPKPFGPPPE